MSEHTAPGPETCPSLCVERSHPGREHDPAEHGCYCWELCSMGPTCPGANAGLDRGCWRVRNPEHWVRKPWPEERYPTPDEWIDWFATAPRDQQVAEVSMALADTQRAIRCLILHPQPEPATQSRPNPSAEEASE